MSKKLYFSEYDENCYSLDYFIDYLIENNLKEMTLFEAKREPKTGYFFCKEFMEVGEVGNCGKQCKLYEPNNGINGRCKHYGYCYEQTEKKFLLSITLKRLK